MSNYLNGFPIRTSVSRILCSPGARHNDSVGQSQASNRISGVLAAKSCETAFSVTAISGWRSFRKRDLNEAVRRRTLRVR